MNNNCLYISTNKDTHFYIKFNKSPTNKESKLLEKIIGKINYKTYSQNNNKLLICPNASIQTPWCTNALLILKKAGIHCIEKIEKLRLNNNNNLIDSLTESCIPQTKLINYFNQEKIIPDQQQHVFYVPIENLKHFSDINALGFDDNDIELYSHYFKEQQQRNPTNVELMDLAQSNSEHSRHGFFKGILYCQEDTSNENIRSLFDLVQEPLQHHKTNSLIAFKDNSSAIEGYIIPFAISKNPLSSSKIILKHKLLHPILTAETHNFPTGICPFPGAATGKIKDFFFIFLIVFFYYFRYWR